MDDPVPPADLDRLTTHLLAERAHKVAVEAFARPVEAASTLEEFLDGLSDLLAVRALRGLAEAIVKARRREAPVVWAVGGHVVKSGVAPVLIRLMERGWINGLAMNGACAIHDWEIAAVGATSEEVDEGLAEGRFGMAEETGRELAAAAAEAQRLGAGFGETLGRRIVDGDLPHAGSSLLAAASRLALPATVHVAIGSDVVHAHPAADGAAIGAATFHDFRRLIALVQQLSGGVWINCGSAVQLPEVFLKALSAARNLGGPVDGFHTAVLDMARHYRTEENVLRRPHRGPGRGYRLLGHHEINVPLLAAAIEMAGRRSR